MKVGEQVEVRVGFTDGWVGGFEIAEVVADGYRVRRHSDGSLLPGSTSTDDVRSLR